MLKFYGYPKCGTCREATKWLKNRGIQFEEINLFEQPPSQTELTEIYRNSGLDLKKFFNVSGDAYKQMNLKDRLAQLSESEQLALLASNGRLIKRPVITDGTRVTVGYDEQRYETVWNGV